MSVEKKAIKILIVGAGPAGLATAIALENLSWSNIRIVEKESKLRSSARGASIGLPGNAMQCLENLRVREQFEKIPHKKIKKLIDADSSGKILAETSLSDTPFHKFTFVMLLRQTLIEFLQSHVKAPVEFEKRVIDIKFDENSRSIVSFNDNTSETFDLVVAAEGANSSLRAKLIPNDEANKKDLGFSVCRFKVKHYKQEFPAFYTGLTEAVKGTAFSIFPVADIGVSCYAHVKDTSILASKEDLIEKFSPHFPKHIGFLINSLEEGIFDIRFNVLKQPVFSHHKVVFIGDASHATTAFLQQGAASAWEDGLALARMLEEFRDIPAAIKHYENFRRERITWISTVSNNPAAYKPEIQTHAAKKVEGWKELLEKDFVHSLDMYVQEHKVNEGVSLTFSPS